MPLYDNCRIFGREGVWSLDVDGQRFSRIVPYTHGTNGHDLEGATVMPAFIDCHCHILPGGLDLLKLHLGRCQTREDVLDAVSKRNRELEPGEWLHAVHYDQTRFSDGVHLTRDDLDGISAERPILLRHVNGHASIANSAALRAAGVGETAIEIEGGEFVADCSGRITGVLLEKAHEKVTAAAPAPTFEEMVAAILAAGERMASFGIGCASDMMTGRWDLERELAAYAEAVNRGCKVRLRLYAQWARVIGPRPVDPSQLKELTSGFDESLISLKGLKIFADGAIGSATAAIYGSFLERTSTKETVNGKIWDGQLIYSPDRLEAIFRHADDQGWSTSTHSIGDYATDLVMSNLASLSNPKNHRIEHAMLLSDEQIDRMQDLGCHCVMQPEFLLRFSHAYPKQLGPERAAHIKRFKSIGAAGIPLSFSSDWPIVDGNPWSGIRSALQRPEGFLQDENIPMELAINAYTRNAAGANRDPDMGEIKEGQMADFQVYKSEPGTPVVPDRLITHRPD